MISSEELQQMSQRLSSEPFNKTVSMVSLDNMPGEEYISLVNEVIHEVDGKQPSLLQCRSEAPEQRVMRHLEFLKGVQFKPDDASGLKAGLLMGEKKHVLPILKFVLLDMEQIKERAYLARYLMKISVPQEMAQSDEEIHAAWEEYLELIEKFKEIHSSVTEQRKAGPNTDAVRNDIKAMEEERKQIEKRVERAEKKVKTLPNHEALSTAATKLRLERQKAEEIQMQIREQRTQLSMCDSRLERANQRLESLSQQQSGLTPADLIERTADELKTANYRRKELLPKALEEHKRQLSALQEAASEPNPDKISLLEKISNLREEIKRYEEIKMEENKDQTLKAVRQNAKKLAIRKEAQSKALQEKRKDEEELKKEVEEKKQMMQNEFGGAPMNEKQLKDYGNELRRQGQKYNASRNELKFLQSENGVLSRTLEILSRQLASEKEKLAELERIHGVSGFSELQSKLEEVSGLKQAKDQQKGETMEDISRLVQELNQKIADKRDVIEPLLNRVRPLRTKHQTLQNEMKEAKKKYDSVLAGIESGRGNLEREVAKIRREHTKERANFQINRSTLENLHSLQDRLQDADTWRDVLQKKLRESEIKSKNLRDQQRALREHKNQKREEEALMWRKVIQLLKLKEELAQADCNEQVAPPTSLEENRLVL